MQGSDSLMGLAVVLEAAPIFSEKDQEEIP